MFSSEKENTAIEVIGNTSKVEDIPKKIDRDECWEVEEVKYHEECPYKHNITVIFREVDYNKILAINSKFPDTEFSVYFNVVKEAEGKFLVTEIIVPKQEVSACSVEYKEHVRSTGVLHKHPKGLANFSGTDESYINANHDISLLFQGGEISLGIARVQTPCKCIMRVGVTVVIMKEHNPEIDEFMKKAEENITKHVYTYAHDDEDSAVKYINIRRFRMGNQTSLVDGVAKCAVCNATIMNDKKVRHCQSCDITMCKTCWRQLKGKCDCCIDEDAGDMKDFSQLSELRKYTGNCFD